MPRFTETISTPAPRERAFDYLADFSSVREWDPSVTSARALDEPPAGPEARFEVVVKALGRETPYTYETIEYQLPARVVFRAETSTVVSLDTITFTETATGTDVTYDAQLELKGLIKLASPAMAVGFKRLAENAKQGLARELRALPAEPAESPR